MDIRNSRGQDLLSHVYFMGLRILNRGDNTRDCLLSRQEIGLQLVAELSASEHFVGTRLSARLCSRVIRDNYRESTYNG